MAQLCIVLDVPGWSGDQLKRAARDIDASLGGSNGEEDYDVKDIISYIFDGQLGVTHLILYQGIQEDDTERDPLGEVVP